MRSTAFKVFLILASARVLGLGINVTGATVDLSTMLISTFGAGAIWLLGFSGWGWPEAGCRDGQHCS